MSTTFTYENEVPDYRDPNKRLTLSVGERDLGIMIGLSRRDPASELACYIEPEEAEAVIRGIREAIALAKAKNVPKR